MNHLFTTNGSGKYAVCGTPGPKGDVVTRSYSRDLCPQCLAWQRARCDAINRKLRYRKRRGK